MEQNIERERSSKGDTYDAAFVSQLKQRKEDIELLFYRFLQQVILHERVRCFNNGMEVTSDLSVSICFKFLFLYFYLYFFFRQFYTKLILLVHFGLAR